MYCIYQIRNKINNKTYIGQHKTNNLNDNYMGSGVVLHQAYEKYGKENFEKIILAVTETKENINILEKVFIKLFRESGKAEYNIADGGDGGDVYKNLSEEKLNECKRKLSLASTGRVFSEESKKKISESSKGKYFSEETRKKISEARKGKYFSEETRKKMSKSRKGVKHKPMSEQGKENIRKSHIGQVAWNKGLKTGPMKDEIKEKIRLGNLGKHSKKEFT